MTKVLGVPKDNPLTWQRALVEREINDVCSGQVARAARMAATGGNQRRGRQVICHSIEIVAINERIIQRVDWKV